MRILLSLLVLFTFTWTLSACGRSSAASAEAPAAADVAQSSEAVATDTVVSVEQATAAPAAEPTNPPVAAEAAQSSDAVTGTAQNGPDAALPLSTELAVGTILLEETALAVDAEQAGVLLPLWQAMQTATMDDPAADVTEIAARIQEAMTAAQIDAIAAMQLTQESMRQMIQNGELPMALPGAGAPNVQPEGLTQGQPGTQPNGRPGGQPGGQPDGGDPDALATRQAERAAQGGDAASPGAPNGALRNNPFVGAVIQLLESKG